MELLLGGVDADGRAPATRIEGGGEVGANRVKTFPLGRGTNWLKASELEEVGPVPGGTTKS